MTTSDLSKVDFDVRLLSLNDLSLKLGESLVSLDDAIHNGTTNQNPRENILKLISLGARVMEEYTSLFKGNNSISHLATEYGYHDDPCAKDINLGVFDSTLIISRINSLDIETLRGNRGLLRIVRSMPEWTSFCGEYQAWCREVLAKQTT